MAIQPSNSSHDQTYSPDKQSNGAHSQASRNMGEHSQNCENGRGEVFSEIELTIHPLHRYSQTMTFDITKKCKRETNNNWREFLFQTGETPKTVPFRKFKKYNTNTNKS